MPKYPMTHNETIRAALKFYTYLVDQWERRLDVSDWLETDAFDQACERLEQELPANKKEA